MEGVHLSLCAAPCGALLGPHLIVDALWPMQECRHDLLVPHQSLAIPCRLCVWQALRWPRPACMTPLSRHAPAPRSCVYCALQAGVGNISVAIFGLAQASGSSIQNVAARAGAGQFSIGNPSGRRRMFTAGAALQPCNQATGPDLPIHQLMLPQQSLPRGLGLPRLSQAGQTRQLLQTCTQAAAAGIFGDINFDCQFIFVEVCIDH